MKLRSIVGIVLLSAFAVACASKEKQTALDINKQEITDVKSEKKAEEKPALTYTCIVQKDTRLIELDKKDSRCEVHYTKFGDKAQVAWAEATPSICSDVYAKIRKNIEDKGFECKGSDEKTSEADKKKERQSASLEK